jgi:rubrerythrin
MSDDYPTIPCPKCGHQHTDMDGFPVLYCEYCGYCVHASITDDVCDLCHAVDPLELTERAGG